MQKNVLMPNLVVEGFNPDDYAQRYEDSNKAYLPLEVQMRWFHTVYPNGDFYPSKPEMDPEHTPGCYSSTAYAWKTPEDKGEHMTCFTSRVLPDEIVPVTREESRMDPYQKCQYRALSTLLHNMGFWVSLELDINGFPEESCDDTSGDAADTTETNGEQPKKRRGRPRKNAVEATTETAPTTEEQNEEKPVEVKEAAAPAVTAEEVKEAVEEVSDETAVIPKAEAPVVTAEETPASAEISEEDYDKASHVTINYRTWQDVELSTLVTGDKTEAQKKKDKSLLHWIASSAKAKEKFSDEQIAAAQVVYRKEYGEM